MYNPAAVVAIILATCILLIVVASVIGAFYQVDVVEPESRDMLQIVIGGLIGYVAKSENSS